MTVTISTSMISGGRTALTRPTTLGFSQAARPRSFGEAQLDHLGAGLVRIDRVAWSRRLSPRDAVRQAISGERLDRPASEASGSARKNGEKRAQTCARLISAIGDRAEGSAG